MTKEQRRTGKEQELGVPYFPSFFEAKDARNNFAGRCGILHNVGRVLIKDLRYNQENNPGEGKVRFYTNKHSVQMKNDENRLSQNHFLASFLGYKIY